MATRLFPFGGARVLGAHLEGPFISRQMRGCHSPNAVRAEDGLRLEHVLDCYGGESALSDARIVTIAPELFGDRLPEVVGGLTARGLCVSLGVSCHSLSLLSTRRSNRLSLNQSHFPLLIKSGTSVLCPLNRFSPQRFVIASPQLTLNVLVIHCLIGHTEAGIEVGAAAMKAGARFVTHLYNAMCHVSAQVPCYSASTIRIRYSN